MSSIEIRKVSTKADLKAFIDFHYDLYEGSTYDAPNLFSDDMNTLSKDKNAAFEFCEAEYYMAFDKATGKQVGAVNIPSVNSAVPMTFLHQGRQYIVFATGAGERTALVALTLPRGGAQK